MTKWKVIQVEQELADQIEKTLAKSKYRDLSEFVQEAIEKRLQALTEKAITKAPEQPRIIAVRSYTCSNEFVHKIKVVKYDDSSIWVTCPMFGWFENTTPDKRPQLGCKERKKPCAWFVG
ncbi:MAG: hypothetical protein QXM22_01790 [Candidatus Bathyarchaeia archaeon]